MSTKPTRADDRHEAFKHLSDFEAPICDLYLDIMTLDVLWTGIGDSREGDCTLINPDEHEQMIRQIGLIEAGMRRLKKQLYSAIGGDK